MHLNIQSLRPKLDILEVEAHPYDVLVLTETWLNPSIPDDDIALLHFQQPFRCDRINRLGGGVVIYGMSDVVDVIIDDVHSNE